MKDQQEDCSLKRDASAMNLTIFWVATEIRLSCSDGFHSRKFGVLQLAWNLSPPLSLLISQKKPLSLFGDVLLRSQGLLNQPSAMKGADDRIMPEN